MILVKKGSNIGEWVCSVIWDHFIWSRTQEVASSKLRQNNYWILLEETPARFVPTPPIAELWLHSPSPPTLILNLQKTS